MVADSPPDLFAVSDVKFYICFFGQVQNVADHPICLQFPMWNFYICFFGQVQNVAVWHTNNLHFLSCFLCPQLYFLPGSDYGCLSRIVLAELFATNSVLISLSVMGWFLMTVLNNLMNFVHYRSIISSRSRLCLPVSICCSCCLQA